MHYPASNWRFRNRQVNIVKGLSSNSKFLGGIFPVGDVEPHTAGIVPSMLQSDKFGEVKVYDFAGRELYYASHKMVLKQPSQPLILLTVDISMSIEEIEKQLTYWTTLISSYRAQCDTTHILIIGSHSDKLKFSLRGEKADKIKNFMKSTTLNYHGFVHCDCRYTNSDNINYLRRKIDTICTSIRRSLACQEDVATNRMCAALMTYLQGLQPKQVIYTVSDLHATINSMHPSDPNLASLRDQSLLIKALKALSSSGHLLFLPHEETTKSMIVLDEAFILSKIHPLLSHIQTSLAESNNETGIITEEHLKQILSCSLKHEVEPDAAIKYLVFLQFCTEVNGQQAENYAGVCYSFPNLTLASRPCPADLWSSSEQNYTQMYGWSVKCAKKGQFFTPKFTQTLFTQLVRYDLDRAPSSRSGRMESC